MLTRQRLMTAKTESVLGTPETLNAATGAMNVIDMTRNPGTGFTQIPAQNGLGQRPGVAAARMTSFDFVHHAVGNGSSGLPYWATHLLPSCGGAFTSQTFAPVANNGTGATLGIYRGSSTTARYYQIAGAMGNMVWTFRAGEICPVRFNYTGKAYAAATQTLPTVTHPTVTAPRFAGGVFSYDGTTYQIDQCEFDSGNTVIMREDPTDSSSTGFISAWITDRLPRVRFAPEALGLASKNWDTDFFTPTTGAMTLTLGSAANNTITLICPALQLVTPPGDGDRNGIYTDVLEFVCTQNGDTEDSEYTIAFS